MKKRDSKNSVALLGIRSRRGQVTMFVILAIIIVAVAALIYFLYPKIKSTINENSNPQSFIQSCVQDKLQQIVYNISMNGGSVNPSHSFSYYNPDLGKSFSVDYLCYTNKDFQPCVMQQPLLQNHIESQIASYIKSTADSCFQDLENNYKKKGYTVNLVKGNITVSMIPNRILVTFNNKLTLAKSGTQRYTQFVVPIQSNLYALTGIANSILQWEVQYGDANTELYMTYYPWLLVQKKLQSDGTKVYILTNLNSGDKFQFATRSFAWPPGYGGNV